MTPEQYERLAEVRPARPTISADFHGDRTLLYGYDVDRRTWHVYQKDGVLHHVVYRNSGAPETLVYHKAGAVLETEALVPNKRLYPECCDYVFCATLRTLGVHLSFTTWGSGPKPKEGGFFGFTADAFPKTPAPAEAEEANPGCGFRPGSTF